MQVKSMCWAGVLLVALGSSAWALTPAEIKAERTQIDSSYKANMAGCGPLTGNAKDVCEIDAKGKRKVAEADLRAKDKPSEKASHDARMARADADYDLAKERCDDQKGEAKDMCVKDAKSVYEKAKQNADQSATMK